MRPVQCLEALLLLIHHSELAAQWVRHALGAGIDVHRVQEVREEGEFGRAWSRVLAVIEAQEEGEPAEAGQLVYSLEQDVFNKVLEVARERGLEDPLYDLATFIAGDFLLISPAAFYEVADPFPAWLLATYLRGELPGSRITPCSESIPDLLARALRAHGHPERANALLEAPLPAAGGQRDSSVFASLRGAMSEQLLARAEGPRRPTPQEERTDPVVLEHPFYEAFDRTAGPLLRRLEKAAERDPSYDVVVAAVVDMRELALKGQALEAAAKWDLVQYVFSDSLPWDATSDFVLEQEPHVRRLLRQLPTAKKVKKTKPRRGGKKRARRRRAAVPAPDWILVVASAEDAVAAQVTEHSTLTIKKVSATCRVRLWTLDEERFALTFEPTFPAYDFVNLVSWLSDLEDAEAVVGWLTSPETGVRYCLRPEIEPAADAVLIGVDDRGRGVEVHLPDGRLRRISRLVEGLPEPSLEGARLVTELAIDFDADPTFGNPGFVVTASDAPDGAT